MCFYVFCVVYMCYNVSSFWVFVVVIVVVVVVVIVVVGVVVFVVVVVVDTGIDLKFFV